MNKIEKAIAEKANTNIVRPGDTIEVVPDIIYISEKQAANIIEELNRYNDLCMDHLAKVLFSISSVKSNKKVKLFAEKNNCGIHETVNGSLTSFLNEKWELIADSIIVGTDDSTMIFGALQGVPIILSSMMLVDCLRSGRVSVTVPETIYIEINGDLASGKVSVDNIYRYLLEFFDDSLAGYAVVIGGNTINQLSIEDRMKVARVVSAAGGMVSMILPQGPLGQVEGVTKIDMDQIKEFVI